MLLCVSAPSARRILRTAPAETVSFEAVYDLIEEGNVLWFMSDTVSLIASHTALSVERDSVSAEHFVIHAPGYKDSGVPAIERSPLQPLLVNWPVLLIGKCHPLADSHLCRFAAIERAKQAWLQSTHFSYHVFINNCQNFVSWCVDYYYERNKVAVFTHVRAGAGWITVQMMSFALLAALWHWFGVLGALVWHFISMCGYNPLNYAYEHGKLIMLEMAIDHLFALYSHVQLKWTAKGRIQRMWQILHDLDELMSTLRVIEESSLIKLELGRIDALAFIMSVRQQCMVYNAISAEELAHLTTLPLRFLQSCHSAKLTWILHRYHLLDFMSGKDAKVQKVHIRGKNTLIDFLHTHKEAELLPFDANYTLVITNTILAVLQKPNRFSSHTSLNRYLYMKPASNISIWCQNLLRHIVQTGGGTTKNPQVKQALHKHEENFRMLHLALNLILTADDLSEGDNVLEEQDTLEEDTSPFVL